MLDLLLDRGQSNFLFLNINLEDETALIYHPMLFESDNDCRYNNGQ